MAKNIRVLLVDDNKDFIKSAEKFLSTINYIEVVGIAFSGKDALQSISKLSHDLVLMDLVMPEMDGLEATKLIKALPKAPLVIIMTVHNNPELLFFAISIGADGFITKSEIGTKLVPLIESLFFDKVHS